MGLSPVKSCTDILIRCDQNHRLKKKKNKVLSIVYIHVSNV